MQPTAWLPCERRFSTCDRKQQDAQPGAQRAALLVAASAAALLTSILPPALAAEAPPAEDRLQQVQCLLKTQKAWTCRPVQALALTQVGPDM